MQLDELRKILRDYLQSLVDKRTGGNKTQFAKLAGIAKPNLVTALSSKEGSGRYVNIEHLVTISQHQHNGLPSLGDMFTELAMRIRIREAELLEREQAPAGKGYLEVQTPQKTTVLVREDATDLAEWMASGEEPLEDAPSAKPPASPRSRRRPRRSR